jgi:hypothetical protein
MWQAPSVRCKWGPYFHVDPGEQKQTVDFVQAARGKGSGLAGAQPLITRRQAVEILAPLVGIENVDAAMDALETEDAEEAKKAADAQAAETELQTAHLHELAGTLADGGTKKPKGDGSSGGKDAKASGASSGGSAAAASKEA